AARKMAAVGAVSAPPSPRTNAKFVAIDIQRASMATRKVRLAGSGGAATRHVAKPDAGGRRRRQRRCQEAIASFRFAPWRLFQAAEASSPKNFTAFSWKIFCWSAWESPISLKNFSAIVGFQQG